MPGSSRRVVGDTVPGGASPTTIAGITLIYPLAIAITGSCSLSQTVIQVSLHRAMTAFDRIDIEIEEEVVLEHTGDARRPSTIPLA
jgi:hypothetical protein